MIFLFVWLMLGVIVALIAGSKGRNAFGWFCYGFLLFPIALVHILVIDDPRRRAPDPELVALHRAMTLRACPHCAEDIKREANVCRYCGRDVAPESSV